MFIRTERSLLRPIWPEDRPALRDAIADEAIARNFIGPYNPNLDDAAHVAAAQQDIRFPNSLIFQRTGNGPRLIGAVGLCNAAGRAELSFWIARPYWGLGYATEAACGFLHAAKSAGHDKVFSGHYADNSATAHVLKKLGFKPTGHAEIRNSHARENGALFKAYSLCLADMEIAVDMPCNISLPYDAEPMAA